MSDTRPPIAIIGAAGRFPGAPTTAALWRLLAAGDQAIGEVPADRWDLDEVHRAAPDGVSRDLLRWGGFIPGIFDFDPGFFGISPREAEMMDPQQRIVLEVSWEALEDAGVPPSRLAGRPVGVFVGIGNLDYMIRSSQIDGFRSRITPYAGTGNAHCIAANRLSYLFDLRGPSLSVDTACSSSLMAVHLAVLSLQSGESELAIVGGVNALVSPEASLAFAKAQMLAPDGRCKTFDARADGYVRAEGCGMIVLKPLDQALRDGDRIRGIIRGTAANQDGRTRGITAPNAVAQEAAIRAAVAAASLRAADIGYLEAHGTGTALGDATEVEAIVAALGDGGPGAPACLIGSVKPNLGHLETASGIAGLLKVLGCFEHEMVPAQRNLEVLDPRIQLEETRLRIAREPQAWPRTDGRRIAGVNSFGFGGTNVHVVIEEPPLRERSEAPDPRRFHVLPLSARSESSLAAAAAQLAGWLEAEQPPMADVAFTLSRGRDHFPRRLAVAADDAADAARQLSALAARAPSGNGSALAGRVTPKVVFLFTGQGSQYAGMGRALYAAEPVFRRTIDRCAEILAPHVDIPLRDLLFESGNGEIDQTCYTQPALVAFECALADQWRAWGVTPAMVLGHSVGEIAAAYTGGVLTLEDALLLSAERGKLMQHDSATGAMAAVHANLRDVESLLNGSGTVAIAAVNAPGLIVITGPGADVADACGVFELAGHRTELLRVQRAFHSSLLDPLLDDFTRTLERFHYAPLQTAYISNVSGGVWPQQSPLDAAYFRRQARATVLFADGVAAAMAAGATAFLEVGPAATLTALARRCVTSQPRAWAASLMAGVDERKSIAGAAAALYTGGIELDWGAIHADRGGTLVSLPPYPFDKKRFLVGELPPESRPSRSSDLLVGRRIPSPLPAAQFELRVSTRRVPLLGEHRVQESTVYPGAAYLAQIGAIADDAFGIAPRELENVAFQQALFLDDGDRLLQIVVHAPESNDSSFAVLSASPNFDGGSAAWTQHATGTLRAGSTDASTETVDLSAIMARCAMHVPGAVLYEELTRRGLAYGPAFRGIQDVWRRPGEAIAMFEPRSDRDDVMHRAATLDAALHAVAAALESDQFRGGAIPIAVGRFRLLRPLPTAAWSHAVVSDNGSGLLQSAVRICDRDGLLVAEMAGIELMQLGGAPEVDRSDAAAYHVEWVPLALDEAGERSDARYLIFADDRGSGDLLATALCAHGAEPAIVRRGVEEHAAEDHLRVLAGSEGDAPLTIVMLWPMDAPGQSNDLFSVTPLLLVAQSLAATQQRARLVLVSRGAQAVLPDDDVSGFLQNAAWGLGRVIATEQDDLQSLRIDLDGSEASLLAMAEELMREGDEDEIAFRNGCRFVPRLRRIVAGDLSSRNAVESELLIPEADNVRLVAGRDLGSVHFEPSELRPLRSGEIAIRVRAAALNFRDVMSALGVYPGPRIGLGAECAGVIEAVGPGVTDLQVGQEVIALAPESFSRFAGTVAAVAALKPAALDFAEAAAIPVAFLTAYYSLVHLARLQCGERVLIHGGAGGVGLAAIQLARWIGAEVYATAGSAEKRQFLRSAGVDFVFDSRSLDFADAVAEAANGKGIDVVLNSLPGEFITRSLALLSPHGRFVEIGRTDIYQNRQIGLFPFRNNISFFALDLDRVARERPEQVGAMLREIVRLFDDGTLKPLPSTVFPIERSRDGLRLMARRGHIGKVAFTFDSLDRHAHADAASAGTYLITGGLGDLGLLVAEWLAQRGVSRLVLAGRSAPSPHALEVIERLRDGGTPVDVEQVDITVREDVEALLRRSRQAAPLRGVVHAAGVLDDGLLSGQTAERIAAVMAPKVRGALHLHELTGGDQLDLFVVFSSVSALFGTPGQAGYAAGNAALDALCAYRRRSALPALSVAWGPWGEVGMAAAQARGFLASQRVFRPLEPPAALRLLGQLLQSSDSYAVAAAIDWEALTRLLAGGRRRGLFAELLRSTNDAAGRGEIASDILAAAPGERVERMMTAMRELAGKVMAIPPADLDVHTSLYNIGMDSLTAMELLVEVERGLGRRLPMSMLASGPTIAQLAARVVELLETPMAATATPAEGIEVSRS